MQSLVTDRQCCKLKSKKNCVICLFALFYLLNPFKSDEKYFLFHLKSSVPSEHI